MAIGGRNVPDTIRPEHWWTLVPKTRGALRVLEDELREMAERVGPEADELLVELTDAGVRHEVLTAIRRVIDTRAAHLLQITDES